MFSQFAFCFLICVLLICVLLLCVFAALCSTSLCFRNPHLCFAETQRTKFKKQSNPKNSKRGKHKGEFCQNTHAWFFRRLCVLYHEIPPSDAAIHPRTHSPQEFLSFIIAILLPQVDLSQLPSVLDVKCGRILVSRRGGTWGQFLVLATA